VVALGQEITAQQVGDDTALGDLETALSAETIDWLYFQATPRVYDAAGQIFRWAITPV
jgi:hypothetical protein